MNISKEIEKETKEESYEGCIRNDGQYVYPNKPEHGFYYPSAPMAPFKIFLDFQKNIFLNSILIDDYDLDFDKLYQYLNHFTFSEYLETLRDMIDFIDEIIYRHNIMMKRISDTKERIKVGYGILKDIRLSKSHRTLILKHQDDIGPFILLRKKLNIIYINKISERMELNNLLNKKNIKSFNLYVENK